MAQGFPANIPEKRQIKVKRAVGFEDEGILAHADSLRKALNVLCKLQRHPSALPFLHPVDPSLVPGYSSIIKEPMDLSTVEAKLRSGQYASAYEFAGDVRKTWSNAFAYNQQGSEIYRATVELSGCFEDWFRLNEGLLFTSRSDAIEELCKEVESLKREVKGLRGGKGMCLQEKKKLGQKIRSLQPLHIRGLVSILKDSLPPVGKGAEFEFDLDTLPNKTCRELEHYVNECLSQALSKPSDQGLTKAVSDSESSSSDSNEPAIPLDEDLFEPVDFPLMWPQKTNSGEHEDGFIMDFPYASAWCRAGETRGGR